MVQLILMLLFIRGEIYPNPVPTDPCSVSSRQFTRRNRLFQCASCSLWVHLSCFGLSPADFRKVSPGHYWTYPMCPSSSKTFPSSSQTVSLFSSLNTCKTQKSSFSKKNIKTTLQLITPPIFVTTLKQLLLTHPQCLLYPLLNPTFHFYSYTIFSIILFPPKITC